MKNVIRLAGLLAFCLGCSAPPEGPRDVLADGSSLPPGLTSLQATGAVDDEGQRIEGIFHDAASGATVRYTTVRSFTYDGTPDEPVYPVDVCIRDASTGEVLFTPDVFGDRSLIEGCEGDDEDGFVHIPNSEAAQRKREAALAGLAALRSVRFKAEYTAERETLVGKSSSIAPYPVIPQGGRVVKEDDSGRVVQFDEPSER
jgi:hypothetical protein